MNDNVIEFPKTELTIDFTPEEMESDCEIVEAVQNILEMHILGIVNSSEVEWRHVMAATMTIAITAGLEDGIPIEALKTALANAIIIDDEENDG